MWRKKPTSDRPSLEQWAAKGKASRVPPHMENKAIIPAQSLASRFHLPSLRSTFPFDNTSIRPF